MAQFPFFLSIVLVLRNQAGLLSQLLSEFTETFSGLVADYELILVDNASEDDTVSQLRALTSERGFPNLQVFALAEKVDPDAALWAGVENALGDLVLVVDGLVDRKSIFEEMLKHAAQGVDIVSASTAPLSTRRMAATYCLMSRAVTNFLLHHPAPSDAYRQLPSTTGFIRTHLQYKAEPGARTLPLKAAIAHAIPLLLPRTARIRIATCAALSGAVLNFAVCLSLWFKLPAGERSLEMLLLRTGLPQAVLFILFASALAAIGEYLLRHVNPSARPGSYYVAQEFTSSVILSRRKLNVEDRPAHPPRLAKKMNVLPAA